MDEKPTQNLRSPKKDSFERLMCFWMGIFISGFSVFRMHAVYYSIQHNFTFKDKISLIVKLDAFYICLLMLTAGIVCFGVSNIIYKIDNLGGD